MYGVKWSYALYLIGLGLVALILGIVVWFMLDFVLTVILPRDPLPAYLLFLCMAAIAVLVAAGLLEDGGH